MGEAEASLNRNVRFYVAEEVFSFENLVPNLCTNIGDFIYTYTYIYVYRSSKGKSIIFALIEGFV